MINKSQKMLFYRVTGNGHPVIFLHGFLESSKMWEFMDLPDSIKKFLIDLPGHGNSFDAIESSTMKSISDNVLVIINYHKIQNYSIVGHSMGGYVGLELMKHDQNCNKLILLNSNFWEDSSNKVKNRHRIANVVRTNKFRFINETIPNLFLDPNKYADQVKLLVKDANSMDSYNIGNISIAISKRKNNKKTLLDKLNRILIIQGESDIIIPKVEMDKNLKDISANYVVIKNTRHMSHIESSNKIKELILSFIH